MFALIHSPLVGPVTWQLVAAHLEQRGYAVTVPTLMDSAADPRPFWEQHAQSAAQGIIEAQADQACLLVGHSGAGPLLPAIGDRLQPPPLGYIFVDAGLPHPHTSRLDMMKGESGSWADEFEQFLIAGGTYPNWSDTDLQSLIPNDTLRQQLVNAIKARGLSFFTERIAVRENWWTTPGGYIQFTDAYTGQAQHARQFGWPVIQFQAGHFHMLVDPTGVTEALIQISSRLLA